VTGGKLATSKKKKISLHKRQGGCFLDVACMYLYTTRKGYAFCGYL
jgi:hypothetical protein